MMPVRVAICYDTQLNIGGVETHLVALLKQSDPDQFEFVIFSKVSDEFKSAVDQKNVKFAALGIGHPLNPVFTCRMAQKLHQERIDLVHAHSPSAALWGRLGARIAQKPCLVTTHLPVEHYHGNLQTIKARIGRQIYILLDRCLNRNRRFSRYIIYVSTNQYHQDLSTNPALSKYANVIPNGVGLKRFQNQNRRALRTRFSVSDDTLVIVFVGRLTYQKGIDVLLDAIAQFSDDTNITLWLIGTGELEFELKARAANLGLDNRVTFWGSQSEIPAFLGASDIFVLPSRYEGLPMALVEAQAAGLPVVVSRTGEIEKWIADDIEGVLVSPEDPYALAQAIKKLNSDEKLRQKISINNQIAAQHYADSEMVAKINAVYLDCIQKT